MRIAYLIITHQNLGQFKRLFRAAYASDNLYLVHVDVKSEPTYHRGVADFLAAYPNTRVMPSANCRWGGYSMVDIELQAVRQLLEWNDDWKFFVNLSGQDFPLKTQAEIKAFLDGREDNNFITVFDEEFIGRWVNPYPLFRPRQTSRNHLNAHTRVERYYWEVPHSSRILYLPLIKRPFINGATWYAGWQWCLLNREFCEYVCHSPEVEKYVRFFRHSFIPDESFFQTVIMNSPYRDTVVNDYLRTIIMLPKGVKIFRESDYDFLAKSSGLIARKFNEAVDTIIIDRLEKRLAATAVASISPRHSVAVSAQAAG